MLIKNNTIELQALLNKANTLPDAGGSNDVQTTTVTIEYFGLSLTNVHFHYINANGNYVAETYAYKEINSLEILKNSIFVIILEGSSLEVHGDIDIIDKSGQLLAFYVR